MRLDTPPASPANLAASAEPAPAPSRGRRRLCRRGTAEIGAAFLCADLAITPELRAAPAAYIASWLDVLKNDKRAIFTAAAHAQRAADYLHSLQPQQAQTEQERAAA